LKGIKARALDGFVVDSARDIDKVDSLLITRPNGLGLGVRLLACRFGLNTCNNSQLWLISSACLKAVRHRGFFTPEPGGFFHVKSCVSFLLLCYFVV